MEINSRMLCRVQWVKGAVENDSISDMRDKIVRLYQALVYKTLNVTLDNVSEMTISDLKEMIKKNVSDDKLISFLRGRMEMENPMVFLNYIVHCVEGINFQKNRIEKSDLYHKRIMSYIYSLYCVIKNMNEDLNDYNHVINISQKTVNSVIERVSDDDNISSDDLYSFISGCFKKDNQVKSIGSIF